MQKQKTMRYQTSDYLDFDTATALVRKLYREEKYALSLLIGCGIFFGLRISDLLSLRWKQLLNEDDKSVIYEIKTNKRRTIKINAQFKPHIQACYEAIHPRSLDRPCFISQKHGVYSVQRINVLLKDIKKKYNLKIEHFSTNSLRKTFGRKIFELASSRGQGELALIKLSELFNHSNASITRIYLGIKEEEMLSTYDIWTGRTYLATDTSLLCILHFLHIIQKNAICVLELSQGCSKSFPILLFHNLSSIFLLRKPERFSIRYDDPFRTISFGIRDIFRGIEVQIKGIIVRIIRLPLIVMSISFVLGNQGNKSHQLIFPR